MVTCGDIALQAPTTNDDCDSALKVNAKVCLQDSQPWLLQYIMKKVAFPIIRLRDKDSWSQLDTAQKKPTIHHASHF